MNVLVLPVNSIKNRYMNRVIVLTNALNEKYNTYVFDVLQKKKWHHENLIESKYKNKLKFVNFYRTTGNNFMINEMVNYVPNAIGLKNLIINNEIDIVINFDNIFLGNIITKHIKKNKPFQIFNLGDYLPLIISENISYNKLKLFASKLSKNQLDYTIKYSSWTTAVSDGLCNYVKNVRADNNVSKITNGVDTNLFKESIPILQDSTVTIGYVGSFRWWTGLEKIIKSGYLLRDKIDCKFLFIGNGPMFNYYEKLVNDYKMNDIVTFTGSIPYLNLPHFINEMDICVIPFKINFLTETSSPLKLFEYMACGRPVISSNLHEINRLFGHDLIYYANTPIEIGEGIIELSENISRSKKIGKKGANIVKRQFDWSIISDTFLKLCEEILN
jgi:glycosyltransferase involved in cell wall biosynthesis